MFDWKEGTFLLGAAGLLQRLAKGLLVLWLGLALMGCLEDGDSIGEDGTEVDIEVPAPDEDGDSDSGPELGENVIVDPDSLACGVFDPDSPDPSDPTDPSVDERQQGVVAELFYRDPSVHPRFPSTRNYIEQGIHVEGLRLFFNRLHVPTRPFDRGFITRSGTPIQTLQGDTLYEWFALSFKGRIRLGSDDEPGLYQLAMLSDDGSLLRMDRGDGEMDLLINNDGDHPTRMACATEALELDRGESVAFELDWHQGPRYHIALVMLWRPWPENPSQVQDVECGRQGNDRYFNSRNDPPTPQAAYLGLLDRGWRPLEAANYLLPEVKKDPSEPADPGMDPDDPENPCNAPAPIISFLGLGHVSSSEATVTWMTDRPATSQIKLREVATGEDVWSEVNPLYQTQHSVTISGLKPNTLYTVTSYSSSTSGLTSSSNGLSFRTRR